MWYESQPFINQPLPIINLGWREELRGGSLYLQIIFVFNLKWVCIRSCYAKMSWGIIISDKLGEDGAVAETLDWLVATRLDVTINVFEAELNPWVATTWTNPKTMTKVQ